MITITEDPARVIPDIMESDIVNKVILIYLTGGPDDYGGIVKKFHPDILRIVGGYLIGNGLSQWCPIGSSLLELLCDTWKTYAPDYCTKIFVIDNVVELEKVINRIDIKNQDIINEARDVFFRDDAK